MTSDHPGRHWSAVQVTVGPVTPPKRQALKISWETYQLLKELTSHAARHGWTAFGIDRDDLPTQSALMEEAIKLLGAQRDEQKPRRNKR